MRSVWTADFLWGVGSNAAAVHLVKLQCMIDSSPEVGVLDGNHLPVTLPLPIAVAPLVQARVQHSLNVGACRAKRDARGRGQRLETTDEGEQFETFAVGFGLDLFDVYQVGAVG
jgi:hypothetical protein